MADLTVNIAGVELQEPGDHRFRHLWLRPGIQRVLSACQELGGISCKGITLKEQHGQSAAANRRDPVWHVKRRGPAKSRRGSFYREGPALAQGAGNGCDRQHCRATRRRNTAAMAEKLSEYRCGYDRDEHFLPQCEAWRGTVRHLLSKRWEPSPGRSAPTAKSR